MQGQDRHHMDQEAKDEKYKNLPGVRTGTTALGLVEHRGNQPFFHVPVFTTPIPKNGKFVTRNPNPLRGEGPSILWTRLAYNTKVGYGISCFLAA